MTRAQLGVIFLLAIVLWTLVIVGVGRGLHALHCADVRAAAGAGPLHPSDAASSAAGRAACR